MISPLNSKLNNINPPPTGDRLASRCIMVNDEDEVKMTGPTDRVSFALIHFRI